MMRSRRIPVPHRLRGKLETIEGFRERALEIPKGTF